MKPEPKAVVALKGDSVTQAQLFVSRGKWSVRWDSTSGYVLSHPDMEGEPVSEVRCDRKDMIDLQWCLTTIKEARQRDRQLRNPNAVEETDDGSK